MNLVDLAQVSCGDPWDDPWHSWREDWRHLNSTFTSSRRHGYWAASRARRRPYGQFFPSIANTSGIYVAIFSERLEGENRIEVNDPEARPPRNRSSWENTWKSVVPLCH